ncbi:MAG: S-ribosylhomocysteine lyase [Clostridiales bacterium]|nr:S-ribosylhomocysteine lyase [Clostridiales bacterium]
MDQTKLKKIASFTVNHDTLEKGMYVSRIDGDVITYDIRMKKPNQGDYLGTGEAHAFEHLFATFARNQEDGDQIVYVGPMGCRTGFYLLTRDSMSRQRALDLVRDTCRFIVDFEGELPGSRPSECGNYRDQNLPAAKRAAKDLLDVLRGWTVDDFQYKI